MTYIILFLTTEVSSGVPHCTNIFICSIELFPYKECQSTEVCPLSRCQKWGSEFLFWGGAPRFSSSPLFFTLNAPVILTFQRCSSSLVPLYRFPLPPLEKTTAPEKSEGVEDGFAISSLRSQTNQTQSKLGSWELIKKPSRTKKNPNVS